MYSLNYKDGYGIYKYSIYKISSRIEKTPNTKIGHKRWCKKLEEARVLPPTLAGKLQVLRRVDDKRSNVQIVVLVEGFKLIQIDLHLSFWAKR